MPEAFRLAEGAFIAIARVWTKVSSGRYPWGALSIKEHVEDLLLRQGAARLRDASEPGEPSDGYVAECPGGGAAIVRGGPVPTVESPGAAGRRVAVSSSLEECADVLIGAGLHVERVQDEHGAGLRVAMSR